MIDFKHTGGMKILSEATPFSAGEGSGVRFN